MLNRKKPKGGLADLDENLPEIKKEVELPKPGDIERLDFRVSDDFKTRFGMFAAASKMTQKELMILSFEEFYAKYNSLDNASKRLAMKQLKAENLK